MRTPPGGSPRCRYCGARIIWIRLRTKAGTNRPHPVEPDPAAGNIVLDDNRYHPDGSRVGSIVGPPALFDGTDDQPRYRSHFATCPEAAAARRTR